MEEILPLEILSKPDLIEIQPISLRQLRRTRKNASRMISDFSQVMLTITAFLVGLFFGFLLRTRNDLFTNDVLFYWIFFGNMAANAIKVLVLPLLITKTFTTTVQISRLLVLKLIVTSVSFFLILHIFATLEAIAWSFLTSPDAKYKKRPVTGGTPLESVFFIDSLIDLSRNIIPEDFLNATVYMSETQYMDNNRTPVKNWQFTHKRFDGGPNYIGLFTMVTIFGCLTHLIQQEKIRPLVHLMEVTENLLQNLSKDISWVSPVVTFCLVLCEALVFSVASDTTLVSEHSILLLVIVSSACLFNLLIFYPLAYYTILKQSPLQYFCNVIQPALLAFSTASSMNVLPITLDCVSKRNKVNEHITIFVIVLGGAIHLTGTILYTTIALRYMAKVYNVEHSVLDNFFMIFMISLAAASLTSSQLIVPRVFRMCGLPLNAIYDIAPINSILTRMSAMTDLVGDTLVVAVMNNIFEEEVESYTEGRLYEVDSSL